MALPKLNTSVHVLELPSTGEEIKFRPFLVKEQKLLMLAQESEDDKQIFEAMTTIIKSCTFDKVDTNTSPLFDIEYIFLKLRAKSVGEKAKLRLLCPDDEKTYVNKEIDLEFLTKIWYDWKIHLKTEITRFETAIKNWKLQPTPREKMNKGRA